MSNVVKMNEYTHSFLWDNMTLGRDMFIIHQQADSCWRWPVISLCRKYVAMVIIVGIRIIKINTF